MGCCRFHPQDRNRKKDDGAGRRTALSTASCPGVNTLQPIDSEMTWILRSSGGRGQERHEAPRDGGNRQRRGEPDTQDLDPAVLSDPGARGKDEAGPVTDEVQPNHSGSIRL